LDVYLDAINKASPVDIYLKLMNEFFFQEYARCVLSDVGYPEEPKQAGTGEAKSAGSWA